MKHFTLLLFSVLLAFGLNGQQLGFSTFSPIAGHTVESDHTMFFNVGEMLSTTHEFGDFSINDGVFQGRALGLNLESYVQAYDDAALPDWNLTSEGQFIGSLDPDNRYAEVQFGVAPNSIFSDLRVVLTSERLRCFSPVDYYLSVCNFGTQIEEGIVWLLLDEEMGEVVFDQAPDYIVGEDLYGWDYDLAPAEKLELTFTATAPEVSEELPPGTIIKQVVWTEGSNSDRNEFCYEQELRCSWDPNDKLVVPNRPDSLGLIDQPLTYTLRFQNTGNDYAEDVVVTDTISDILDMSTFQLISTSHPDLLQVEYTREDPLNILNFRFENIFLPDSITDNEGSNGFITFMISVKEGVPLDTKVENTGHIYFDFNPAVVTNTTGTTLVDQYPVDAVRDDLEMTNLDVYPNPSKGLVFFEREVQQVAVYDLSARLIGVYNNVSKLNLTDYDPGSYLLNIIVDDKRAIEKLVLTK